MAEYTETKAGKSSGTTAQTRIFKIVSGKNTSWKLDGNNYLQWKQVIKIFVGGPSYLSDRCLDTKDGNLLHQVLITMERKIQDFVVHCVTLKELWCFLWELYGGSSNINRAYDVIHELFRKKQNGQPIYDHYGEFNHLAEEFRQIFLIMSDVKQMQKQ